MKLTLGIDSSSWSFNHCNSRIGRMGLVCYPECLGWSRDEQILCKIGGRGPWGEGE